MQSEFRMQLMKWIAIRDSHEVALERKQKERSTVTKNPNSFVVSESEKRAVEVDSEVKAIGIDAKTEAEFINDMHNFNAM